MVINGSRNRGDTVGARKGEYSQRARLEQWKSGSGWVHELMSFAEASSTRPGFFLKEILSPGSRKGTTFRASFSEIPIFYHHLC